MIDCKCTVRISYQASGDTIKVILDGIAFCERHSTAALVEALEAFVEAERSYDPNVYPDPLADAYELAVAALELAEQRRPR